MPEGPGRRGVSRRTVLSSGLATATVAAVAGGMANGMLPVGVALSRPLNTAGAPAAAEGGGVVTVERVYSAARGRKVDLVTILPDGLDHEDLPVCLLLHGRFGNARSMRLGDIDGALAQAVEHRSVPPYAFLAVDGGENNYWHQHPGDDPMAMLLEEVPLWLAERSLGGADRMPFAAAGISMGGFGALLYARRREERRQPLRAVAAIAPALITSWHEMRKRNAFVDAAQWASLDPLRSIDKLGKVPVGVWCGTEDRFIEGARRFIKHAKPAVASTGRGGHNVAYYRAVLPDVVRFVGKHVP